MATPMIPRLARSVEPAACPSLLPPVPCSTMTAGSFLFSFSGRTTSTGTRSSAVGRLLRGETQVFDDLPFFRPRIEDLDIQRDGRAIEEFAERLAHLGGRWQGRCILREKRRGRQQQDKAAAAQSIHDDTPGSGCIPGTFPGQCSRERGQRPRPCASTDRGENLCCRPGGRVSGSSFRDTSKNRASRGPRSRIFAVSANPLQTAVHSESAPVQ